MSKNHPIQIHPRYLALFFVVLGVEICIALFFQDNFVRPYGGDVLAVVWVYAGIRSIRKTAPRRGAAIAFSIACLVELGQLVHIADRMGLAEGSAWRILLGTGFDGCDFLAYLAGALLIVAVEALVARRRALAKSK